MHKLICWRGFLILSSIYIVLLGIQSAFNTLSSVFKTILYIKPVLLNTCSRETEMEIQQLA